MTIGASWFGNLSGIMCGALLLLSSGCGPTGWLGGTARDEERLPPPRMVLADGDYVSPRFSPDGRALAFAERVTTASGVSAPHIWVVDLGTGERRLLLHADSAARYAAYGAWVVTLEWEDPETLFAVIHDGDVASTQLVLDARTGRIRQRTWREPGVEPLEPERMAVLERLRPVRPEWPEMLLEQVARHAVLLGDHTILFQKNYHDQDHDLWIADLAQGSLRVVRRLPEGSLHNLVGAVVHGTKAAVLIRLESEWELLFVGKDAVRVARTFARSQWGQSRLEVRWTTPDLTIFIAQLDTPNGTDNPLLSINDDGITEVVEEKRLFDADVSPDGAWLALNLSDSGQRRIEIVRWPE